ncbi:MAG: transcriptional repressor LexA [Anaerolineae bacterium]|jgi:repressor LexA|nr:transcriptional repressor LexA [Anaerolineae bacterium]NIO00063.1 transcriptional repressor LexA [Anaerolineae bacterium]NIQ82847.1 transcriptional repressor LexA [Anaerolineae bacterium]
MSLSKRQEAIVQFIDQFLQQTGYPPSIRDIGSAVGISSTSVVNYNLKILEREGYISRDPEVSRGLRLVGQGLDREHLISLPLLGRIAAGDPIPVPGDAVPEEHLELARGVLREDEGIYALQVQGESMIDALVNDGDIVVMKHQEIAENGDMVAVWLRDREETTLKKFYHEGDRIRLQPANPTMEPIYANPSNVEVQGKVVMVIRQLQPA